MKRQLRLADLPLILTIGVLSFIVHELAHWLCGVVLGYDMYVGINKAGLASGSYRHEWHGQLVSAAGPLVTIALAALAFVLIARRRWTLLFPVVFFSTMMRALAAVVSIGNPNDEARISLWLGIGKWSLPLLVLIVLAWWTYRAARRLELGWRSWAICFVGSSIAITVVVLTEQHWPIFGL